MVVCARLGHSRCHAFVNPPEGGWNNTAGLYSFRARLMLAIGERRRETMHLGSPGHGKDK